MSANCRDPTHLSCVRCGVVEIKYAERHCVSGGKKLVATRCSRPATKDQPNEGQQPTARGAERGQQPAARGSRTRAVASRHGQQNEGSSQPPGAVERGQQPADKCSRTRATASHQRQNEGSSQPPEAAKRG